MKNLKKKIKTMTGITLISLVITIIVLIILAGISISLMLENDGILNKSKTASEEYKKNSATEMMNLKITTCQMQSYTENGKLPSLAYLAAFLQKDKETTGDIAYVEMQSQEQGNLDETPYTSWDKLYTKLSAYPSYEFEINSSLQLASINGVKVASIPANDDDTIISMTKAELKTLIQEEIKNSNLNVVSSEDEYVVQSFSLDNQSVASNKILVSAIPIDKEGYTPLLFTTNIDNASSNGINCSWVYVYQNYISENNANVRVRNFHSSQNANIKIIVTVLFKKNQ